MILERLRHATRFVDSRSHWTLLEAFGSFRRGILLSIVAVGTSVSCSSEPGANESALTGGLDSSVGGQSAVSGAGGVVSTGGTGIGGNSSLGTGGGVGGTAAGGSSTGGGSPVVCELDQDQVFEDVAYFASKELRGRKPGDIGNDMALDYAEAEFKKAGLLPGGVAGTYRQSFPFAEGQFTDNVLGLIPGTDPLLKEETILVGAHIDHLGLADGGKVYTGADDNASGSAVVLELARMFGRCGLSPKRSLLFVEWNAEEMGIIGSRYYVDHPIVPLEQTLAVYNFDMVGAGDGTGVLLFGGHDEENLFLTQLMEGAALDADLDYTIQIVPQKLASDHAPFVEKGIPICWGFARPDPHPGYHTPDDDLDNINPDSLKAVTELFWAALRPLALGEEEQFLN